MAKETLNVRVTRLEELTAILLEEHAKTEQRFRQVADQFAETDKRIAALVSAIGELIRSGNGKPRNPSSN